MTDATYLLDTNILSEMLRNPFGALVRHIDNFDRHKICTSAIVASEMRFGAHKKGAADLIRRVEALLTRVAVLPYTPEATHHYAAIRTDLERRGTPIGWADVYIAAHARSLGLTVVTANTREFRRVPDLKVENWLEDTP